jgi:hypothetical protein
MSGACLAPGVTTASLSLCLLLLDVCAAAAAAAACGAAGMIWVTPTPLLVMARSWPVWATGGWGAGRAQGSPLVYSL